MVFYLNFCADHNIFSRSYSLSFNPLLKSLPSKHGLETAIDEFENIDLNTDIV